MTHRLRIFLGIVLLLGIATSNTYARVGASFQLGERIFQLNPAPSTTSPDDFRIGKILSRETLESVTDEVRRVKTIGKAQINAVLKAGNLENYIQLRGVSQTGGKVFEYDSVVRYNSSRIAKTAGTRLESTASLGNPHDPADLILYDTRSKRVLQRYQLKLGRGAAIEAVSDAKYADCIVVTPPDQLDEILEQIRKEKLRGRISPRLQRAKEAIQQGRLTSSIDNVVVETRIEAEAVTKQILTEDYYKVCRELGLADEAGDLATGAKYLRVGGKVFRVVNHVIVPLGFALDALALIHACQQLESGVLDKDIAYAKVAISTGYATIGVVLACNPEPFVTKVAFLCLAACVTIDLSLDYWQARRNEEFRQQQAFLGARGQYEAARDILLADVPVRNL